MSNSNLTIAPSSLSRETISKAFPSLGEHPKPFLNDAAVANFFGSPRPAPTTNFVLSPGAPRHGNSYLTFFSAMLVITEALDSNNIVLFDSQFPAVSQPGVQLSFEPIKKGQHLVEST